LKLFLCYGVHGDAASPLGVIIEQAELRGVLERLPEGLQTPLGDGGGLVSGGEGQRVRWGRALLRPAVRLVILDEPFRGLDRAQHHGWLARARQLWCDATRFCITHDVGATQTFARVLVIDGGRLVEDGAPDVLVAQSCSRYRGILEAEATVHERLWSGPLWRRLYLEGGRLTDGPAPGGL
jgi:ABC-type transport system involved in cytochrome bd biosynthesis fused ATPase/permease subunit